METIKKIGLLFLAFFSFVCIVGGMGHSTIARSKAATCSQPG